MIGKPLISLLVIFCLLDLALFASAQWVRKPDMLMARSDFRVASDGLFAYVAGGCNQNQPATFWGTCQSLTDYFTRFNFATETWEILPSMPRPRYRYASVYVNGSVYYIGGRDLMDAFIEPVDVFNVKNLSWSTLPYQNGLTQRSDFACWVNGTKIACTGGYNADYSLAYNSTIVMDVRTGLFSAGLIPDRLVQSGDCRAQILGNKVFVFGGFNVSSGFCNPLASLEMFDASTNSWTMMNPMKLARGNPADVTINGLIYAIGGEHKDAQCNLSVPIGNVGVYNPLTNAWTDYPFPLALPRFRFSAATFQSKIYDLGGQGPTTYLNGSLYPVYPVLSLVYALDVSVITPTGSSPSEPSSSLSTGAIVGIVIGIIIVSAVLLVCVRKALRDNEQVAKEYDMPSQQKV